MVYWGAYMVQKILILDNIRSVLNVGSLFRTANAIGIDKVYLCGITPGPLDRFGLPRKDFAKVSLGSEQTVSWERVESTLDLVEGLVEQGTRVVALEQDERAVDYKTLNLEGGERIALVLGPEVSGMSQDILDRVSVIIEIPMRGSKESLNVAVAGGIALYRIFDR